MNFKAAQEALFRDLGLQTSAERKAWQVQEVRDALNWSLSNIFTKCLYWYNFVRTGTLSFVSGTSGYELGDDCLMPICLWKETDEADKLWFITPEEADRLGLRSTSLYTAAGEPYNYTSMQGRHTASKETVVNVSGTAVTYVSGDAFADADVGKRVRINGESADYYVSAHSAPNITLNRGYVAPATGEAAFSEVTTATSVTLEVSPPPVRKIEIVPAASEAITIKYRYSRRPKYMLADTDVPDALEEEYHQLWVDHARCKIQKFIKDKEAYWIYKKEADAQIIELRSRNVSQMDTAQMRYEALYMQNRWPGPAAQVNQDRYRRGG